MDAVVTALTTSFTSVATSITGVIGDVLPIALPVVGAMIVVRKGISIFKGIVNKQENEIVFQGGKRLESPASFFVYKFSERSERKD